MTQMTQMTQIAVAVMKQQVIGAGWVYAGRNGVQGTVYKNREGWQAHEIFRSRHRGAEVVTLGWSVFDERGGYVGFVKTLQELP